MAPARARLFISGRVQGVFYRAFTEEVARARGLTGWVRNTSDGRVEAVFQGEKQDIESAIEACRSGPPAASVRDVDVSWESPGEDFGRFSVKYF